jgi:quinoprotein glucose dehydrogenase
LPVSASTLRVLCSLLLLLALAPAARAAGEGSAQPVVEWPHYGGDPGGLRYSPLADITPDNVSQLEVAWTYHTGDMADDAVPSEVAFEVTPILVEGTLYLCSPFNRVIALDAESGAERWTYDPHVDVSSGHYANQLVCRGVAFWRDPEAAAGAACRERILSATADARLIAVDAATGKPCSDFGEGGQIDLNPGAGPQRWKGEYQVTSPPVVVSGVVVVGSAVSDNQRVDAPSGVVRAFDLRSGKLRWAWDLAPPNLDRTSVPTSEDGYVLGTPNVWAPMSADPERDLLFVPTGNPAPDYSRSERLDRYGSSVVALRASTGEVVWSFQTVHHDLWDYDVPAQPTLAELRHGDKTVPAVIQATKMGMLFVLHRETGKPIFPVKERPVPQGGAPGEPLSPTQPFPVLPPPLVRHNLRPEDAWGLIWFDTNWCRDKLKALRYEGIYTPPSLKPTLMYPGNAGGTNWGGVAVDPERQLVLVNQSDFPWVVTLFPRDRYEAEKAANPGVEISPQDGRPYALRREPLLSPIGVPCNPPPWGTLAAVDLTSGRIRWQVRLGTTRDLSPIPISISWGTPNLGGPVATKSGVVFIAAALDDYLRAFDVQTGAELWKGRLPAGGQATPMTYRARRGGRQYVVVAAGGHERGHTTPGDAVVAFALPE